MKARWTIATTFLAVVVATLALAGTAIAQSSQTGKVTHIDETFIDPYYSELCGFPVRNHQVLTLFVNDLGNQLQIHDYGAEHLTNVETGTTVTIRAAINVVLSKATLEELLASGKPFYTFHGVDYVISAGPGQKVVSAGRGAFVVLAIEYQEGGIIVDIAETTTPHLVHLNPVIEEEICGALAR